MLIIVDYFSNLFTKVYFCGTIKQMNLTMEKHMNKTKNILCDMHSHSRNSHDSNAKITDMANACLGKGVRALAITDHCDIQLCNEIDIPSILKSSLDETEETAGLFDGKVEVLKGIEIGEAIWNKELASELLNAFSYDAVIASVHAVRYEGYTDAYSTIDFSKMTDSELDGFMQVYFDDLLETVQYLDCDIVAHLTCPLRYINGKYGRGVDAYKYRDKILEILDVIIKRPLCLEVNTSGIGTPHGELMPPKWILREYKEKGGCLVSLGSDAHSPERIANGFDSTIELLRECGFDAYYYYKQRKPNRIDIK